MIFQLKVIWAIFIGARDALMAYNQVKNFKKNTDINVKIFQNSKSTMELTFMKILYKVRKVSIENSAKG